MYTIGQVSEMFHLPVSTLRYYDKEGLFPNLKRESGIRKFNDHELEALRMLKYKCWYYDQAMKEGNEDKIRQMLPDNLPKDIQQLYDNGHK